MLVELFR